tara:strand:+ start:2643 stop:2894 length:252 start_codon:yes stop_codon:yes gene_type:complete
MAKIAATQRKALWVDDLLKESEMDYATLCKECNLPEHIISRIIHRQWQPTKVQMQCVAGVFGRKPTEVIFGNDFYQDEERGCS